MDQFVVGRLDDVFDVHIFSYNFAMSFWIETERECNDIEIFSNDFINLNSNR